MSIFKKRYCIKGWEKGTIFFLTAEEIYRRVMKDSKSDYNWFAPATELVKVCDKPDFPELYAREIKIAILNCFANLEKEMRRIGLNSFKNLEEEKNEEKSQDEAVYSCYHSLSNTNAKSANAKRRYLEAKIKSIMYAVALVNGSPTYKTFREEWEKRKVEEYASKEEIDFEQLKKECEADFQEAYKKATDEGLFEEEEEDFYL